jgi:hypothetical protein
MNQIYVSVVATRRFSQTKRRSVHIVKYCFNGPARALEQFAASIANEFGNQWELNVMQITLYEYQAFQRQLNLEEASAK